MPVTVLARASSNSSLTTYNTANYNFGAGGTLVISVMGDGGANARTVASVTANGVAMTRVVFTANSTGPCAIFIASGVPAGLGTLSVTYSGICGGQAVIGYLVTGLASLTATATSTPAQNSPISPSLTVAAGGGEGFGVIKAAGNITWTPGGGLTTDVNNTVGAGNGGAEFAGHTTGLASSPWTPTLAHTGTATTGGAWATFPLNTAVSTAIDQTLLAITQTVTVAEVITTHADQTLFGLTQAAAVRVEVVANTDTLLFAPSQALNVIMHASGVIDQTLFGFTQEIDASELFASVDMTLAAFSQVVTVKEVFTSTIDTLLPGFIQEADDVVIQNSGAINMVLCASGTRTVPLTPLVYLGTAPNTGNVNPATFSGMNFGTAADDRWLFACITSAFSDRFFVSVTIGGILATRLVEADGLGTSRPCAIYVANVPSGTVGTVVVTLNGTNSMQCSLFSTTGNLDVTPVDSFVRLNNFTPQTVNLGTRSGGVALGIASGVTIRGPSFFDGDFDTQDWINDLSGGGQGAHKLALTTGATLGVDVHSVGSIDTAAVVSMGPNIVPGFGLTQELLMDVPPAAVIAQTLPGFTQAADADVSPSAEIDQTLRALSQSAAVTVTNPVGTIIGDAAMTLPGIVQAVGIAVSPTASIDQTFEGFTQLVTMNVPPFASIGQELLGFTQRFDAFEAGVVNIDQTLLSIVQEADVQVDLRTTIATLLSGIIQRNDTYSISGAIDQVFFGIHQQGDADTFADSVIRQTLPGFTQEIDVSSINATVDQTLLGFAQEIEIDVDDGDVIALSVDTVLPGFTQEIDATQTINIFTGIRVVLEGLTQRATGTVVRGAKHPRHPHAIPMPSKDMPINPQEMELFRRSGSGRAVDAMVPPASVAHQNMTTSQYPSSRSSVMAIPPPVKPR